MRYINNEKFIEKWSKIREKGFWIYILRYILIIPIAGIIGGVIGLAISLKSTSFLYLLDNLKSKLVGIFLLVIVEGVLAVIQWNLNENKYNKY